MKYKIERAADGSWIIANVWKRGHALLNDALLNKGTAFTAEERELFELDGMLPPQITDRARQSRRAYEGVLAKGDRPLEKYLAMASLQDRNETLFYQVLAQHVKELTPIVYTPTVGDAAVRYSHVFRRGRGLWITPEHRGRIFEVLGHARNEEVRLIVATDNERILGLGDQGAGGMVIPIGKLTLYTLAAGIHPAHTLPISLDVGTDNEDLLADELYVGWRHHRLRGSEYDAFIDEFVDAAIRRFPGALLQWEDFKKANAFALLDRYRHTLPSFNDDIQGTAAVVVAGVMAACRATGTKLSEQRFVMAGAGAAGVGIARQLRHALENAGLDSDDLDAAVVLLDSRGLVVGDRDRLEPYKREMAWSPRLASSWGLGDSAGLIDCIEATHPTVIIGTTGQAGLFDEDVIRSVARHTERPVVMALSNPTSKSEALPSNIVEWTDGRAIIATGSPFEPVRHGTLEVPVSQCNNVYVFPGVGLGCLVSGASIVTDSMFTAAAEALASQVDAAELDRGVLFPPIEELRLITRRIAAAVVSAARDAGVGRAIADADVDAAVAHESWDLDYPILHPV